eukprot:SAG11_NODE_4187_length_2023_cov_1.428274_2_plen_320_part_00
MKTQTTSVSHENCYSCEVLAGSEHGPVLPGHPHFVVQSGPCTLDQGGRCVGRPSGYENSESCRIFATGSFTLGSCPVFNTESGHDYLSICPHDGDCNSQTTSQCGGFSGSCMHLYDDYYHCPSGLHMTASSIIIWHSDWSNEGSWQICAAPPRPPPPPPPRARRPSPASSYSSHSSYGYSSYEPEPEPELEPAGHCTDDFPKDFCDQLAAAGLAVGAGLGIIIASAMFCLFFPLIMLACAMCTCVSSNKKQSKSPNGTAWLSCCLVFWLVCVLGTFLCSFVGLGIFTWLGGFTWYGGSMCMIIPFCCSDACCASTRALS